MARDFFADWPDDDGPPEPVAEMPASVDRPRRKAGTSRAIPDGREGEAAPAAGRDAQELLGAIGDGLVDVYRLAQRDGDPLTVMLVERALLHVGRRLAAGLTPADVGLACH